MAQFNSFWFEYFIRFDPQRNLSKLQCKVLALNGSKDIQVLAASNPEGIGTSSKKNNSPYYEVKELPGLNYLFQTCVKCTLEEYAEMEETFLACCFGTDQQLAY